MIILISLGEDALFTLVCKITLYGPVQVAIVLMLDMLSSCKFINS